MCSQRRLTRSGIPWPWSNAGIGSNQVVGPRNIPPDKPFPGGPSARQPASIATCSACRASRTSSGSKGSTISAPTRCDSTGAGRDAAGAKCIRDKARGEGDRRHADRAWAPATRRKKPAEVEQKRRALNDSSAHSGVFDGVVDFDRPPRTPGPAGCGRVRPGQHGRRTRGQAASEPRRVHRDGRRDHLRLLRRPSRSPNPRPRPAAPGRRRDSER